MVRRWYGAEPSVPQMLGGCVGWRSGIAAFRRRCEDFSRRLQRVHKSLTPHGPFAAGSLSGYGGLKPILPFLGVRSDAACRVVIRPSRPLPMGTYGLYHDAARGGRALAALSTASTEI